MTMESVQITLVILPVNVILDTLEMDSHVKVKLTFVIRKTYILYIIGAYILIGLFLHFGYFNFKASYGQHSCIILNFYLQYMGPSTRYNRLEN